MNSEYLRCVPFILFVSELSPKYLKQANWGNAKCSWLCVWLQIKLLLNTHPTCRETCEEIRLFMILFFHTRCHNGNGKTKIKNKNKKYTFQYYSEIIQPVSESSRLYLHIDSELLSNVLKFTAFYFVFCRNILRPRYTKHFNFNIINALLWICKYY